MRLPFESPLIEGDGLAHDGGIRTEPPLRITVSQIQLRIACPQNVGLRRRDMDCVYSNRLERLTRARCAKETNG